MSEHNSIHPTAVVHPSAVIGAGVQVGPFCVIEKDVSIGAGTILGPHVTICSGTTLGENNRLHSGCVLGDCPQDLKYKGEPTRLRIGDNNIFREHFTAHRSNSLEEDTTIGSGNFFMADSHVGHNSKVGNHVVMANGSMLGGHVLVQDSAFLSGNCMAHQFTRIGVLALMQGGSGISQDLPPFTVSRDINYICGLNIIGLQRAGFSKERRLELKRLYHVLFRSGKSRQEAIKEARMKFVSDEATALIHFVASSKRGICGDWGGSQGGD